MNNTKQFIIIIVVVFITFLACKEFFCKPTRENMAAGYSTISGLAFNNKAVRCSEGNLLGSSSPYCEGVGYVLF
jgi:hypothetical protein